MGQFFQVAMGIKAKTLDQEQSLHDGADPRSLSTQIQLSMVYGVCHDSRDISHHTSENVNMWEVAATT